MPKNRSLTYGDQQAQVAREKKLAKLKPPENKAVEKTVSTSAKKKAAKKPSAGDL